MKKSELSPHASESIKDFLHALKAHYQSGAKASNLSEGSEEYIEPQTWPQALRELHAKSARSIVELAFSEDIRKEPHRVSDSESVRVRTALLRPNPDPDDSESACVSEIIVCDRLTQAGPISAKLSYSVYVIDCQSATCWFVSEGESLVPGVDVGDGGTVCHAEDGDGGGAGGGSEGGGGGYSGGTGVGGGWSGTHSSGGSKTGYVTIEDLEMRTAVRPDFSIPIRIEVTVLRE